MRYVRMLTNALLGGLLGAAFVTILVLQLNRQIPLEWSTAAPLYGRLALFYAPHLTVAFYAMLVAREALARRPLSPGWLSIRILSWVGLMVVGAAAALMWLNFVGYRLALDDDSGRRLAAAAGATTLCAVLLLVIAVVHYSFGRRGSRVGATLLTLTLLASVGFPLTARGWGDPRPLAARAIDLSLASGAGVDGGHVTIIAVDGASLDYIAQRVADGRLPAFGRLLEGGVSLYLETLRPTQPTPVWTTVATGKYPPQTGVRAAARYEYGPADGAIELLPDYCFSHALVHFGLLRTTAYQATAGARAAAVDDPEQPARLGGRRRLAGDGSRDAAARLPRHRSVRTRRARDAPAANGRARRPGRRRAARDGGRRGPLGVAGRHGRAVRPWPRDAWRREIAVQLRDEYRPRLLAVRYEGIDRAGHLYLRHARPRDFGSAGQDGEARLGRDPRSPLRVPRRRDRPHLPTRWVPTTCCWWSRASAWSRSAWASGCWRACSASPTCSGTHEDAPDGFLLAYGGPVRSGRARLGSLVDVAPTVLYVLGLPGRARHGRRRPHRPLQAGVHRHPSDRLHPHLRAVTGVWGQSNTTVLWS